MTRPYSGADFCADAELGYLRSRTKFVAGESLSLDESYRLAHLPLVAPNHPRAISSREGANYAHGLHPMAWSLVMPVKEEDIAGSSAYGEMEAALKSSVLSGKIAWDIVEPRRHKLHATICGSLGQGEAPHFTQAQRDALADIGPIEVELRGLFSGNVNVGRLYLRAYPERRDGGNMFQKIQAVLGRKTTDLYLVGLYNLTDDLNAAEAEALDAILRAWWDRPVLRFQLRELRLLGAKDDLVLDSTVADALPLTR